MTSTSEEQQGSTPENLTLTLAIAGRLDAQLKLLAQNLHKDKKIYYGFAVLDSLNCSYSMFKYYFDVFATNNSSDAMHDLMMTPGGICAIFYETVFIVSFAFFATDYNSKDPDTIKRDIAKAWPYFRDIMKGLKNAYKGFRSTAQLINMLGGVDIKYLIMPLGLALGMVAAINRILMRYMLENRKTYMDTNATIIQTILECKEIRDIHYSYYLNQIKSQSKTERIFALGGATLGGLIDSLYLYVGVISVAALTLPLLIAVVSFCIFYSIACVVTRIYEEFDYQLRLLVTHSKIYLALATKNLHTTYQDLLDQIEAPFEADQQQKILHFKEKVSKIITEFLNARKKVHQQTNHSYFTAFLLGIKHGIYAYSALSSIVFLIASILALSSVAFHPAFVVTMVALGAAIMLGFVIHSMVAHYKHLQKQKNQPAPENEKLQAIQNHLNEIEAEKKDNKTPLVDSETFKKTVNQQLNIDSSPKYSYPEWFEVGRSGVSGLTKGQKFVDFAFNPLQEQDDLGHYHDSPVMLGLGAVSALVYSSVLSLRALAKGVGKDPLGQVNMAEAIKEIENSSITPPAAANINPQATPRGEPAHSKEKKTNKKQQPVGPGLASSPSNVDLGNENSKSPESTPARDDNNEKTLKKCHSLGNIRKLRTPIISPSYSNRKSMDLFFYSKHSKTEAPVANNKSINQVLC